MRHSFRGRPDSSEPLPFPAPRVPRPKPITPLRDARRSVVRPSVDSPSPPPRKQRPLTIGGLPEVPAEVRAGIDATRESLDALIAARTVTVKSGAKARQPLTVADVGTLAPEHFGARVPTIDECVDEYGWRWLVGGELTLSVTHLMRPVADGISKGELLRYYVDVAPYLLRALAGRPLVVRRHTEGGAFYQQHVNARVPSGVGTLTVDGDGKPRFVGGSLVTLLYLVQLGAISMDPWHGRADAPELVDYAIIDLDPGPETPFSRVIDVARWVHDELLLLGLSSVPKTSGATGMHIVVPLPSDTSADTARLLSELVATQVAGRHRKMATVARSVRDRALDAVYVDYLQNIPGKTVASVYSARATPTLTVSTPLHWTEVTPGLDPGAFTIASVPKRLADVGDLWAEAMRRGNDLEALRRVVHDARSAARAARGAHA